ncbi:immunity 26/phosphotriesterase HocA family protein [Dactylosporangium sp. AC04546]|uniref:immunity 26/phosphotriesterase HocA family protein n=1 Tax=Dactylosporangium sp. AC04546 TaxID=2862460 RepID=UPI001EDCCDA0|nr:immunity 26/phosphotriesterase HocA family protein [Dactylosporangium sp. AC04546]WVK86360.1 immunity 26/phosphotriesterase HocA family protein [Dactylosporangium sp. AC04546]
MTGDAVVVRYTLSDFYGDESERAAVYGLQERLRAALDGAGEFGGNEFGDGGVTLFLYGPDADRLYAAATPLLRELPYRPARVRLRYGDPRDEVCREGDLDGDLPAERPPARRWIRAAEGDVFRVPVDASRSALGQVVAVSGPWVLVVIFDEPAFDADILLMALTFDDCLAGGEWPIVERRPVRADVPWPVYKMSVTSMGTFVEDHFGNKFREATPEERRTLRSRSQCSPEEVTDAARAAFGVGEWLDRYDYFIVDHQQTVARIIGSSADTLLRGHDVGNHGG